MRLFAWVLIGLLIAAFSVCLVMAGGAEQPKQYGSGEASEQ
jgi:hypothetical protein